MVWKFQYKLNFIILCRGGLAISLALVLRWHHLSFHNRRTTYFMPLVAVEFLLKVCHLVVLLAQSSFHVMMRPLTIPYHAVGFL